MNKALKNKFKVGNEVVFMGESIGEVLKIEKDHKGFIYWVVGAPSHDGSFHSWFREEELKKINKTKKKMKNKITAKQFIKLILKKGKKEVSMDIDEEVVDEITPEVLFDFYTGMLKTLKNEKRNKKI